MEINKNTIIFLLSFVLLLPFPVIAEKITPITVNTLPNHNVEIYALDPSQIYYSWESFRQNSSSDGKATVTFVTNQTKINIKVRIKKDNFVLFTEMFKDYETGKPIELYVPRIIKESTTGTDSASENASAETNTTNSIAQATNESLEVKTQSNTEKTNESASPITGSAISTTESSFKINWIYYVIILAVIAVGIVLFLMREKLFRGRVPSEPRVKFTPKYDISVNKELAQAEKKLAEAQADIQRIKNHDKILEAQRKLEEDRIRLEKLKAGIDPDHETGSGFRRRF